MKEAILYRNYGPMQTLGNLFGFDGKAKIFECVTLELPWFNNQRNISCIPGGVYMVYKNVNSDGKAVYKFEYVIERTYIQIHSANFLRQLLGCIAVGERFNDLDGDGLTDVTYSGKTLANMFEVMGDKFKLTIV